MGKLKENKQIKFVTWLVIKTINLLTFYVDTPDNPEHLFALMLFDVRDKNLRFANMTQMKLHKPRE